MQNENTQAILRIFRACAKPLTAVLDGIDDDQLYWKPAPESRSIGEIMRHLIRVDNWFLKRLGYKPQTEDPGEVAADRILKAMQRVHSQIESILTNCTRDTDLRRKSPAPDAGEHDWLGDVIVHISQHYLYHLAQAIYLRRIQDRDWQSPMKLWEEATYVISTTLTPIRNLQDKRSTKL